MPVVDTAESYDIVVDFNNKIKIKISYNENRMYLFEAESDEAIYNCKGYAQISDELPKSVRKRVAVEALSDFGWYRYVGLDGKVICMKTFGASGPANQLFEHFGFTVENVVNTVKSLF